MKKQVWWKENVDEIFMGAFICAIAGLAILFVPQECGAIAGAAIGALGGYLVAKNNKDKT